MTEHSTVMPQGVRLVSRRSVSRISTTRAHQWSSLLSHQPTRAATHLHRTMVDGPEV